MMLSLGGEVPTERSALTVSEGTAVAVVGLSEMQHRIVVATDASAKNAAGADWADVMSASAGWLIAGLKPDSIKAGHCLLPLRSPRIELHELRAIEIALKTALGQLTNARREQVTGLLILVDSEAALWHLARPLRHKTPAIVTRIKALVQRSEMSVEFRWVRGHVDPWNRAADGLAELQHSFDSGLDAASRKHVRDVIISELRTALADK